MNPNKGKKESWPKLVGKPFSEAKSAILRDRPDCHVDHIKPGTPMIRNLDYFRVFVITDGIDPFLVKIVPHCG